MEDVEPTVSRDEIRQILFADNDHVRNEFVEHFGPGINNFVILMDNAYRAIAGMETQVPNEDVEPTVSRDEIRQILFADNDHVRNEFSKRRWNTLVQGSTTS